VWFLRYAGRQTRGPPRWLQYIAIHRIHRAGCNKTGHIKSNTKNVSIYPVPILRYISKTSWQYYTELGPLWGGSVAEWLACLCSPSSKIGSSPLKGCRGNCRPGGLTAKNRDQLRNHTLGNRVLYLCLGPLSPSCSNARCRSTHNTRVAYRAIMDRERAIERRCKC